MKVVTNLKSLKMASQIALMVALLALCGGEVVAQQMDISNVKAAWSRHKTYTLELLNEVPEEKLDFRPSKGSRSFKELMLHIAQSNYGFSSMIVGKQSTQPSSASSKEQVAQVVAQSFDFLLDNIDDVKGNDWAKEFPWGNRLESSTTRTRAEILSILKEHAAHHRGQATVYLRLMGITPPEFVD